VTAEGDRIVAVTGGRVSVASVPGLAQVDLRLDPHLADRAPYPLPHEPNTAWEDGPRAALWLGPDEWLVLGPPGEGPEIAEELERSLQGLHRSIVDVTAARLAIEAGRPGRFELLSTGCSLDLHPRSWGPGRCAQTLLARVPVILHERSETTGILVRSSFADHLVAVLLDAAEGLAWSR
jgi:sarcosine oxidase subunit gamma